jgi:transcriptional regulator of acetoin/glycerol metabolism
MRLQKYLARAGVASRRHAEVLIQTGKVKVNGHTVTTMGYQVQPGQDQVAVNGKIVHLTAGRTYILLYKPAGYVTTVADPQGRPKVTDLVKDVRARLYPVGRLDFATEGAIERVGGIRKIAVDVRIIAATNRNLEKLVENGEFREDLYYRLNVIPIEMPPLRERTKDIELLLHHFLEKYARLLNKPYLRFSSEALQLLRNYNWPGNVRELENAVEYAVNMAAGKKIIAENLPKRLRAPREEESFISLAELEKKELQKALNYFGNNVEAKKKIAEVLGISVATVYRKLKFYGLHDS